MRPSRATAVLFLCGWDLCLRTTGLPLFLRWLPHLFSLVVLTAPGDGRIVTPRGQEEVSGLASDRRGTAQVGAAHTPPGFSVPGSLLNVPLALFGFLSLTILCDGY